MNFGAQDEAINQELTEGGAFCDVAPRLCFLGVFWITRAGCKSPPYQNRRTTFEALSPIALVKSWRWILVLEMKKSAKN